MRVGMHFFGRYADLERVLNGQKWDFEERLMLQISGFSHAAFLLCGRKRELLVHS